MAASWPSAIKTFSTKVDNADVVYGAHINAVQDEITALQQNLGVQPQGGHATVKARLANVETTKFNTADIPTIDHNGLANLTVGNPHTQYLLRSIWAAKGDILGASAAGTPTAVSIGVDGSVLQADSTSPTGFRWASAAIKSNAGTAAGQLLVFDGTNYVNVSTTGVADGWALVWDSALPGKVKWANVLPEDVEVFGQSGTLAVTTGKGRFRWPWAVTILGVAAAVNTPSAGGDIVIDVNRAAAGSLNLLNTIYTNQASRPTIAAGAYDCAETVPAVTSFGVGDHMTIDIDGVGTSAAGSDLSVLVRYRRTA